MQQEISFPDHIEAYGKAVAKELRVTVLRLNEMNVDYSKATGTKEFREKFYKDWFDASAEEAALALIRFLRCDGICMASRSAMSAA